MQLKKGELPTALFRRACAPLGSFSLLGRCQRPRTRLKSSRKPSNTLWHLRCSSPASQTLQQPPLQQHPLQCV